MTKQISNRKMIWEAIGFFFVPFSGFLVSITTDDWTWFARFGSLMVALSIASFFLHFASNVRLSIKSKLEKILAGREAPADLEGLKELLDADELEIEYHSQFEFILGSVNAFVGTLIWGFGDLIGCFP